MCCYFICRPSDVAIFSKARKLFKDSEEALEFMEEYGFEAPRASLLETEGRLSDAAESKLAEGDVFGAIQLFIRGRERPESVTRAVQCLLQYLWRRMCYGTVLQGVKEILDDQATLRTIFDFAGQLRDLSDCTDDRDEVCVFFWCKFAFAEYIHSY